MGRLEAGIGAGNSTVQMLAAWGDFGDVKGYGVKAGWRFGGARSRRRRRRRRRRLRRRRLRRRRRPARTAR